MEHKFHKIKNLASRWSLPGLSLNNDYLLLGLILVGVILISGCSQMLENGAGQSQTSMVTASPLVIDENGTVSPPTPEIGATAILEPTPTLTPTSFPFEPLKVNASDCEYGGNFKGINALDALTVQFSFCEPEIAFPSKMAFPAFAIQSAEWLAQIQSKGDIHQLLKNPVGTGPYQVSEWKPGETLILRAFDNYWEKGNPKISKLIFTWNKDPSERLLALQTHVVDGIDNVNHADFSQLRDDPDSVLVQRPSMNVFYIGMNNTIAPYENDFVRQALTLALDRQKIVDVAFPEGYEVASHFAPCAVPYACEGEVWYPFDPDRAKDLLSEAGYPNGFQTELFYRDVLRGYLPRPDLAAEEIRTQLWENLRVNVKVRKLNQDKFIADVDSGALEGLYLLGWGADFPDMTNFLDPHFGKEASQQFGEKNTELIDLLEEGAAAIDNEERREIYQRANDIILRYLPMIPVAHGGWYSHDRLAIAYHTNEQSNPVNPFGFESFSDVFVSGQDIFIWMQAEEPISLYCPDETDSDSLRACVQISESLYKFGNNSAVAVPNLAENCAPNENFTVWTCSLRNGVYFHDGSTLDANDVVMSFWIQWDDTHPLHVGNSGKFDYFKAFWGSFISMK